jgi:hypothetical protein
MAISGRPCGLRRIEWKTDRKRPGLFDRMVSAWSYPMLKAVGQTIMKTMTADEIGSTPTGGLELNFTLNTKKTNKINGPKTGLTGLNQAESRNDLSRPTGGTSRLLEDDFPLKYSSLNAFSASASAHCSSRLYHFDSFKQPITSTISKGNAETDCTIKRFRIVLSQNPHNHQ